MEIEKLASLFLPQGLLAKFDVVRVEELCDIKAKNCDYHIWIDEKNILSTDRLEYESKGFTKQKTIQDFPIRGKAVFLHIRRRLWRHKQNKEDVIKSNYQFEAKGVKLTEELANFLK